MTDKSNNDHYVIGMHYLEAEQELLKSSFRNFRLMRDGQVNMLTQDHDPLRVTLYLDTRDIVRGVTFG